MGKIRSLSRNLDPLCVWKAKQKAEKDKAAEAELKQKRQDSARAALEEIKKLVIQNENQPKQEEAQGPSNGGAAGLDVPDNKSAGTDSVVANQAS